MLLFPSCQREVAEYSRVGQASNPQMLVCTQLRSQFAREISLLRYMSREMRSLTDSCSTDDEDCLEVVPTTRHHQLPDRHQHHLPDKQQ